MVELSGSEKAVLAGVLLAYVVGLFLLSIYATTKVKNEEDYLVAGRRLPLFLAWGTLMATWFGAASMLGASQAAREEGLRGTVLDPFACAFTLILAGLFFAKPLWNMKLLTMGDFYREKYGTRAEILSCSIQVPSYFGWIAAQYVALGAMQQAYFGYPLWVGILIGASITLVYTMIGGMWSVTLTDTAQLVIALFGLVVLADVTFSNLGGGSMFAGINHLIEKTPANDLTLLPETGLFAAIVWTGTWATGLFGNLPGQDLQQRVFASKSARTAQWACILAGVVYLVFGLIPVGLGLASRSTHPGDIEGKILPVLAANYFSPLMRVVFTLALVSIIVSTATSAVLAPAAMLGHNLLSRLKLFDGHHLFMERLSVFVISMGGLAISFSSESIMDLLDASLSIALVGLFVPLSMGIYGKPRGELPALLAMSFGFGSWVVRFGMENVFLAAPKGFEGDYPAHMAALFPAEKVGSLVAGALHAVAFIPESLLGLSLSFFGYFLGQAILKRRMKAEG